MLAGTLVTLGFFALIGFCLWRGIDLDPVLQAINGPFGLVAAIGVTVQIVREGKTRAQLGRTEALAGREGPSVVREQLEHIDARMERLEAVLGEALSEFGRAAHPPERGAYRQDTGLHPAVQAAVDARATTVTGATDLPMDTGTFTALLHDEDPDPTRGA